MRERLGILGIVAFVVVDVVLVALAVQHTRSTPPSSDLPPIPQSPQADEQHDTSRTQDREQERKGPPQPLYSSLAADGVFIRATRGDCKRGITPTVEVSTNRGGDFRQAEIRGLTEVLRVQANGADSVWVVGTDSRCRVGFFATEDGGRSWQRSDNHAIAWYLVPDQRASRVHAPDIGVVNTPCRPIGLSTIDAGALRVLCSEGRVIGTEDGGRTWVVLGRRQGAVAIRYTTPGDGYAVARLGDCRAAVLRTADGGATWEQATCLDGGVARTVAAEARVVLAQVGDTLHISEDSGATWRAR